MGSAACRVMPPRSPWVCTCTPMFSSNSRMVATSRKRGTLRSMTGWSLSKAAHNSGNAAFLAPETVTVPFRRRPPTMRNLSMASALRRPLGRRVCFHRQGVHLVGVYAPPQRGVHHLVPGDRAFALESGRHHHGGPVAAIARHFQMGAGQSVCDELVQLLFGHVSAGPCSRFSGGAKPPPPQRRTPPPRCPG